MATSRGYCASGNLSVSLAETARISGEYDDTIYLCYTEVQLRMQSLHRFKGLQAKAVILAEVDFVELDDKALQRIYVGMTRERHRLLVILLPAAESTLREKLI